MFSCPTPAPHGLRAGAAHSTAGAVVYPVGAAVVAVVVGPVHADVAAAVVAKAVVDFKHEFGDDQVIGGDFSVVTVPGLRWQQQEQQQRPSAVILMCKGEPMHVCKHAGGRGGTVAMF